MSRRLPSPLLLACLGAAVMTASGGGLWRSLDAHAQDAWPSVEGEIVHSGIDARAPQARQAPWPLSLWRQRPEHAYRPVVRYRYAVADVPYLSDRIGSRDPARGPREAAEAEAARFPEGTRVRVYYDPGAPGTAVLAPAPRTSRWGTVGGAVGLLAGLGCLGAGLWSRRQRPLAVA
ncbi:MAG: DUF3592 domain-containing protein [Bacteroidota bacterium]